MPREEASDIVTISVSAWQTDELSFEATCGVWRGWSVWGLRVG